MSFNCHILCRFKFKAILQGDRFMKLHNFGIRAGIGLAMLLSQAGAAHAADPELLEILLTNGVITQEQYDRLMRKKEPLTKKDLIPTESTAEPTVKEPAVKQMVAEEVTRQVENEFPVKMGWGKKGFKFETRDGNWATNLQWRAQMRYTYPERSDPRSFSAFSDDEQSTFELRRVRMKIGGHGYRPWLKYYFEVDLQPTRDHDDDSEAAGSRVIDWRIMLEKYKWASLQLGQWKINYNRERVDSSGRQQFVERSIVNRIFTVDRQMGAMLYGHLMPGTLADSRYYVGVWTGEGRGVRNDDDHMMYMGRLQWNFLGRDLKWRQTDVEYHEQPAGSIAFAAATVRGRCTRWSSSGCGNLDGFDSPSNAENGQFRVSQMMEETAFKWRGFSFQHEYHWKRVEDRINNETASMWGSYAQAGYFFHDLIPMVPKGLELAFRYAFVEEPERNRLFRDQLRQEYTGAVNYFFAGHNNKVTVDYSYLTLEADCLTKLIFPCKISHVVESGIQKVYCQGNSSIQRERSEAVGTGAGSSAEGNHNRSISAFPQARAWWIQFQPIRA